MKIDFYKVVIIILLSIIAYGQILNKDVNRYKFIDHGELIVFDTKTGNFYSPKMGVYELVDESIEFEKSRKKEESSKK